MSTSNISAIKSLNIALGLLIFFGLTTNAQELNQEFLNSLPEDLLKKMDSKNNALSEENNELLNYDTSLEDQKTILKNLQTQIDEFRNELNIDEEDSMLQPFGSDFFNSIQTTFAPFDIPNMTETYTLGPGDKLEITIISSDNNSSFQALVANNGSLTIPDFGRINITGFSLDEAEEKVRAFIRSKSIGAEVYTSLTEIKNIQVAILGFVKRPGIYTIAGNSNYIHALKTAGGISKNGSFRSILHKRGNSTLAEFDLYKTFAFGDIDYFSTIRSGDVLFVNPKDFIVPLSGGVNFQGLFEMKSGETLDDLIKFAGGFAEGYSGLKDISLKRIQEDKFTEFSIDKENISKVVLEKRDIVMVPSFDSFNEATRFVQVDGFVNKPGVYTIKENEKLSSVISRAGGYKNDAYIYGAALFRKEAIAREQSFAKYNYSETIKYIISNFGKGGFFDSSSLKILIEEIQSQDYTGRVVANFDLYDLEQYPHLDLVMQDGDKIFIPGVPAEVYVFGEFQNPAIFTYSPDSGIKDYISMAGGVKSSAFDELVIIDPDGKSNIYNSKSLFFNNSVPVYPGSIIYAQRNIQNLEGLDYAAAVTPILSSLALSLASLNSIID